MPSYTSPKAITAYYDALTKPVNAQMNTTKAEYKAQNKALANEKAAADAQAYRSHQRQMRMFPSIASASGAHGGMVQSALGYQNAAYQQGRADRDVQYQQSKDALLRNYNATLDQLRAQAAQYKGLADADKAELEYLKANGTNSL